MYSGLTITIPFIITDCTRSVPEGYNIHSVNIALIAPDCTYLTTTKTLIFSNKQSPDQASSTRHTDKLHTKGMDAETPKNKDTKTIGNR